VTLDSLRDQVARMRAKRAEVGTDNVEETEALEREFKHLTSVAVMPFIKSRPDLARRIAENYGEYNALIQICNADSQAEDLLRDYLYRFIDTEFPSRLFDWYRQERKSLFRQDKTRIVGRSCLIRS
jgi:hypothetical protein